RRGPPPARPALLRRRGRHAARALFAHHVDGRRLVERDVGADAPTRDARHGERARVLGQCERQRALDQKRARQKRQEPHAHVRRGILREPERPPGGDSRRRCVHMSPSLDGRGPLARRPGANDLPMTTGTPPPGPPPQQPQPLLVVPGAGWVDVASRAIVQVGFPVVVAGVLLYYILFKFQQNMDTITSRMAANTTVAQALVDADKNLTAELIRQT